MQDKKIFLLLKCKIYESIIKMRILIKEILKDMINSTGDAVMDYHTLPVTIGLSKTKQVTYGLMLLSIVPPVLLYFTYAIDAVLYYFIMAILLIGVSGILLAQAKITKQFRFVEMLYKAIIILGIISITIVNY